MLLLGWLKEHGGFHPFLVGVCLDHLGFDVFLDSKLLKPLPIRVPARAPAQGVLLRDLWSHYHGPVMTAVSKMPWNPCESDVFLGQNIPTAAEFFIVLQEDHNLKWHWLLECSYFPFFLKPKICLFFSTNSGGVPEKPEWICTASHRKRICLEVVVLKSSGNFSVLMTLLEMALSVVSRINYI